MGMIGGVAPFDRELVADLRRKRERSCSSAIRCACEGTANTTFLVCPRQLIEDYAKRDPIKVSWEQLLVEGVAAREELDG